MYAGKGTFSVKERIRREAVSSGQKHIVIGLQMTERGRYLLRRVQVQLSVQVRWAARWCWRKPGEQFDDRYVIERRVRKHGGGNVMVWGCITTKGLS